TFGTSLQQYRRHGKSVRLAAAPLSVPTSVAGLISGVSGVDQRLATPKHVREPPPAGRRAVPAKKGGKEEIPQPEGFRNAPPCSGFYGEKLDLTDPAFGGGYPAQPPYAPCGYKPPQLQSAYGLSAPLGEGVTGAGVTVAITDAYVSPTLLADAQQYANLNQP